MVRESKVCQYCGRHFKTKGGAGNHERFCKKNPDRSLTREKKPNPKEGATFSSEWGEDSGQVRIGEGGVDRGQVGKMDPKVQPGQFSYSIGTELVEQIYGFLNTLAGYKYGDQGSLRLTDRQKGQLDAAFAAGGVGATNNPWVAIAIIMVPSVAMFVIANWSRFKENEFFQSFTSKDREKKDKEERKRRMFDGNKVRQERQERLQRAREKAVEAVSPVQPSTPIEEYHVADGSEGPGKDLPGDEDSILLDGQGADPMVHRTKRL